MPRATPTLSEFLTPRQGSLTTYVERVENIAGMNIVGIGQPEHSRRGWTRPRLAAALSLILAGASGRLSPT